MGTNGCAPNQTERPKVVVLALGDPEAAKSEDESDGSDHIDEDPALNTNTCSNDLFPDGSK